jgi:hypothetical protein
MYTQCPECKKQHSLTIAELRSSNGVIDCDQCEIKFDALELLKEQSIPENRQSNEFLLAHHQTGTKHSAFWVLGFSLCLALMAFQIYFFEAYNLSQNNKLRPWLEKICNKLNCQLPVYKNLADFSIIHGSFELTANKSYYVFKTTFVNQSAFKQHHPAIKLTLQTFTGLDFAERIFLPQEYLNHSPDFIKPDMSVEISMNIAIPSNEIGGYRFELI